MTVSNTKRLNFVKIIIIAGMVERSITPDCKSGALGYVGSNPAPGTMANQQLFDYIRQQIQSGISPSSIIQTLIQQGWQQHDIDEALSQATTTIAPPRPKNHLLTGFIAILLVSLASIGIYFFVNTKKPSTELLIDPKPAPTQQSVSSSLEQTAYTNSKFGFKINAPKGWRTDESGQFGTLVFFFNNQTDKEGENQFTTNINVTSESVPGLDLDTYVAATKEMLPKLLQNYRSTEDRPVTTTAGSQARIIGGTFVQGVFHIKNIQLILIEDSRAYIVTATSLESAWDKHKDLLETSLLTFR